jgi:hypothetical protein
LELIAGRTLVSPLEGKKSQKIKKLRFLKTVNTQVRDLR